MKVLFLISMLGIILLMIKPSQAGVGSFLFNTSLKITHPIKVHKNLAYGTQSWQQLNVYPAKTDQEQAPVLVFVYGGAWHKGSKEQHHFVADAMVRKGYTVVIADYAFRFSLKTSHRPSPGSQTTSIAMVETLMKYFSPDTQPAPTPEPCWLLMKATYSQWA